MDGLTAWVSHPPTAQGLDHLGTQAPCISLYSRLLPGITNVTDRARYYSLYPWLIWKFDQRFKTASPKDFETFYRRADCLLTLVAERHARCAQEAGALHGAAMIGRLTLLPALDRLEAGEALRLSTYATTEDEPGARYFKNRLGGLGQYYVGTFLDLDLLLVGPRSWLGYTHERGEVIAKNVEEIVPADLFLKTIQEDVVSLRRLDNLAPFCFCHLKEGTKEHKFLADLFFGRLVDEGSDGQQRRHSLSLVLSLVDAMARSGRGTLDIDWVRGGLYGHSLGKGAAWNIPPVLAPTAQAWATYVRNDLLSIAAQTVFFSSLSILDQCDRRFDTADGFGRWLSGRPAIKKLEKAVGGKTFGDALRTARLSAPPQADWDSDRHEFQHAFDCMARFREIDDEAGAAAAIGVAVRTLVLLAARIDPAVPEYDASLLADEFLKGYPINLQSFRRHASNGWQSLPVPSLIGWLIKDWGIDAHLRIALRKLRNNPQATFRLRPTDQGLAVEDEIPPPVPTNPRLRQAIQILRDLRCIEEKGDPQVPALTPLGKALLAEAVRG
ncbi:MAG: hypothetical protein AB7P08_06645 [Burkholderiales bacterium]